MLHFGLRSDKKSSQPFPNNDHSDYLLNHAILTDHSSQQMIMFGLTGLLSTVLTCFNIVLDLNSRQLAVIRVSLLRSQADMTSNDMLSSISPGYFVAAADMTAAQRTAWYEELVAFDTLWTEIGPASFTPVYARDADRSRGEVFPELWYLNDCHVIGIQHLELARILLAVYNPKIPRLGPGQRIAMRSVDLELKSIVKRLCGIALSNQQTPPGLITACVAIGMCGDRFTDRAEQQSLLAVLVKLEDEHAWPTHTTQKLLKEAWGWYEVDNHELIVEMNT